MLNTRVVIPSERVRSDFWLRKLTIPCTGLFVSCEHLSRVIVVVVVVVVVVSADLASDADAKGPSDVPSLLSVSVFFESVSPRSCCCCFSPACFFPSA